MECIFLNIINNFYIACLWKTFFTVYFFVVYDHAFRIDCNHETTKETALLMICKLSWGFVHVFSSNCLTTYICCCDQSAKQKKTKAGNFFSDAVTSQFLLRKVYTEWSKLYRTQCLFSCHAGNTNSFNEKAVLPVHTAGKKVCTFTQNVDPPQTVFIFHASHRL